VFNSCGNLHISDGGGTNRVAVATETKLSKVTALPEGDWNTSCFSPEESAAYVMQIDDGQVKFSVKFRIVQASEAKIVLEWLPFTERPKAERGTVGTCGAPHACT
jgi:hypothetical protein